MLNIKGFKPTTLVDYPGQIAAVIFLSGCNFRCPFCHNPELVFSTDEGEVIEEEAILNFLDARQGKIEGLVITGGEPCMYKDLIPFIKKVKEKGFLVKLDTNGAFPETLEESLPFVDFISMDIKSSLTNYEKVIGVNVDKEKIKRSVELIKHSGKEYEFRTTVLRSFFSEQELKEIGEWLKGSKTYVMQQFDRRNKIIDEELKKERIFLKEELYKFKDQAKEYFDNVKIRGI